MMIITVSIKALAFLLLSSTEGWYYAPILCNSFQGRSRRKNNFNLALFVSQSSVAPTTIIHTSSSSSSMRDKNRKPRVPTVDSTLLRFLSIHKRHAIQSRANRISFSSRTPSLLQMEDDSTKASLNRQLDTLVPTESSTFISRNQTSCILPSPTTLPTTLPSNFNMDGSISSSNDGISSTFYDNSIPSSSSPFHADRIAERLIDLGAPAALALEAGHSVQNHVSFMNTRLNIIQFLRHRSTLWKRIANTSSTINDSNIQLEKIEGNTQGNIYNIEQVLDILSSAGFTGKDIAAIFVHTPIIARMNARKCVEGEQEEESMTTTLQETIQHTYIGLLCQVFKLRKCDARKIVRTCPGLLTKKGSKAAKDVSNILFSLGVTATSLSRDKSVLVSLLSRSPQMIFRLVAFLSSDYIQMPLENIGPLIRRMESQKLLDAVAPISYSLVSPSLLKAQQPSNGTEFVSPSLTLDSFLTNDKARRSKIIDETYKNMTLTATFLAKEIGISDVGKVISSYPSALLLDTDTQIRPCLEFLISIGIDSDEIPRVIESFPSLLAANVTNMEMVTQYLTSLEVSPDIFGNIVRAFPSILTLSVEEKMIPVVDFLRQIGVTNIGRFVTRLPPVLGYSVSDELAPKWNFLNQTCQYASFEVIRFPAYFSYPLERVIMNRYEYLRIVKRMPVQLLPVDEILRYGDADFARIIANDQDEGQEYLKFIYDRNKLRRQA